ncbi:methylated-DNA--[protein]-cysteine S-methyltransferase [Roseomonas sp. SSH11]|uniref:Methylated-DNA--[protein]-cysteine S-methyltransferase n=1 Tax=Pararoseomonas baculiformis TaxID=2820812 RepID=A0ABS4A9P6_9PROT|nr:methylated-DNA--[protein]-cysteine S-methyltransferase [Pararoseomonas baculiformis]MBP0443713.1 methylated-DNA--[protein]-cysteine S-methyltransferase [Pararoseomonas baculiformis]
MRDTAELTISHPDEEALWQSLLRREAVPGWFYGVTSQRIVCRLGCPARPPLRRHVRFFPGVAEAVGEGFRPCRRCDPDGARAAIHAGAVRMACAAMEAAIEAGEDLPSLADLAARAGYARHHFLRLFREVAGLTPHAYAAALRARRLGQALAEGERVVDAVIGAGFSSESRVYEDGARLLGMTPGTARRGGAGEVIRTAFGESALGPVMVGLTARGVCAIEFGEDEAALRRSLAARFPQARIEPADEAAQGAVARVLEWVREPRAALDLPLDLRGTAFQKRVWEALRSIPPGDTLDYAELATRLGMPRGARAVARACASNGIALAVPCHRVIGRDGALRGYRWGLERKAALLAREGGTATAK